MKITATFKGGLQATYRCCWEVTEQEGRTAVGGLGSPKSKIL